MFKAITIDELLSEVTTFGQYFECDKDLKWSVIGINIVSDDRFQYGGKVTDLAGNIAEELVDNFNTFVEDNQGSTLEDFTDQELHHEVISSWVDTACIYYTNTADLLADSPSLGLLEDYKSNGGTIEGDIDVYKLIAMELHCWMDLAAYRLCELIQKVLDERESNSNN